MRSVLAFTALLYLVAPAVAAERPNIVLITADDLGCQLSCYGEKRFSTPRLDALAAQGARFENFYVAQSSCSASRSALLTGRWPHQNGQLGLAHLGFRMHPDQPNLPALFKAAGYRTGIIGKLHVEPAADFPWDWMPTAKVAAKPTQDVKWVAQQSRTFLASAKEARKPFFYYVNFFDPHGPYTPEVDQVAGIPENPVRAGDVTDPYPLKAPTEAARKRITATIINTIRRVDAGVGLLLDELESAGLASNTLVVFLGDNGLPLIRGKTWCYEAGVHVPLLMRGPGIEPNSVRGDLASEVDLAPTLLEAADLAVPRKVAGQSLMGTTRRELLFTEMNFHEPQIVRLQRSVRDDRFKLLLNLMPDPDQEPVELFDLQADPGETRNLAGDANRAEIRGRLETALQAWRVQTGDPTLDAARVRRWQDAALRWGKIPKVPAGPSMVVHIPEGELNLLQ
ncbi:MAG: sulfatase family protein [Thermoguttaceae bacterium]